MKEKIGNEIRINPVELASELAHNVLVEQYGEDALWRENITEFVGLVYRDEVRKDFDNAYDMYYDAIINQRIGKKGRIVK